MNARCSALGVALLALALTPAAQARAGVTQRPEVSGVATATGHAGSELLAAAAKPRSAAARKAAAKPAPRPNAVPFIIDDYDRALAAARAARLPLFIESWAPW